MSSRIRILPENLTNKIAAGEVVERPASVVKELAENSLDAGCREIVVEIESGGKRLIRVADDGCGMSREDALLCLERHATSKIATDRDLFSLSTLGFRGEALPSVASVSRFSLETRERGSLEGSSIYAEGGRVKEVKACGMAEGTVITVRNLFFNTPARLKFMKSNETESGHVGDLMTRLAISRPDVRFAYANDGKIVFRVPATDLKERIAALLGRSLTDGLFPVAFDCGRVKIDGFIARPDCSRSSASHMYTYINGRYIRDRVVQHAILQAYKTLLERGRYPVVVLFISVPDGEVDVNVHPTKHEVRFREQGQVHDGIFAAVENVLKVTPWIRRTPEVAAVSRAAMMTVGYRKVEEVRDLIEKYVPAPKPVRLPDLPAPRKELPVETESRLEMTGDCAPAGYYTSLSVIGQYLGQYILCQDGTDLVIIDQHAAHERTAFEKLKKDFVAGAVESQNLLFPETMELSFREAATLRDNAGNLMKLGFAAENFGGNTWVVNAVPRFLEKAEYMRILRDIIEDLQDLGKSSSFEQVCDEILARLACHSVIRGGQLLTMPEIKALFAQMDATAFSGNCPHGRPVVNKISRSDMEKMFRR